MRSVLWHFRWFFSQLLGHSCTSAVCPRSFPCAWLPEIALPRATNQCALCSNVHFCDFSRNFCLFFRGGSNMVAFRAKVDGTWQAKFQRRLRHRVTGLRPSGLPNLPFSLVSLPPPLSSNSLSFLFFSPIFLLFTPFPPPFPSLVPFFPTIFQHFSFISSHFPLFPVFSLVKPTCLSVTSLPTLCPLRHLKQANATCCESAFLLISRHFWARPKNEGPN